jgi:hypothetical protein
MSWLSDLSGVKRGGSFITEGWSRNVRKILIGGGEFTGGWCVEGSGREWRGGGDTVIFIIVLGAYRSVLDGGGIRG